MNTCRTCQFFSPAGVKEDQLKNRCTNGATGSKTNDGIYFVENGSGDSRGVVFVGPDYGCNHFKSSEFKSRGIKLSELGT